MKRRNIDINLNLTAIIMRNRAFRNKDNAKILIRKVKDLWSFPLWRMGFEEENYRKVKISIKEEGIKEPIIVTSFGLILDGHHRWKALVKLGVAEVPCKVPRNFIEIFKIIIIGNWKGGKRAIAKLIRLMRKILQIKTMNS